MTLPRTFDGPVLDLALFRAVSSLLATTTLFDREGAQVEAEGTMSHKLSD